MKKLQALLTELHAFLDDDVDPVIDVNDDRVQKAMAIGADKHKLLKRLKDALSMMNAHTRDTYRGSTFDAANKRLISADGNWVAQWAVRRDPLKKEAPDNQQTSIGAVLLVSKKTGDELLRAWGNNENA